MTRALEVVVEEFPLAAPFRIARGVRTHARVVTAIVCEGSRRGRGECTPYARYGESAEAVLEAIGSCRAAVEGGIGRAELRHLLPPGAARNALDCALWDLEAKTSGRPARDIAGQTPPYPIRTLITIGLDTPEAMAAAARARPAGRLKLKLGAGDGFDAARIRAVREAVPDRTLTIDANEGWAERDLDTLLRVAAEARVAFVEQPLPAGADAVLATISSPVPLCADESIHVAADIDRLRDRYGIVNVKLDKAGGLTEALAVVDAAEEAGLAVMVGCMLGSSLAMAPAVLLAQRAHWVDLDGPLWLAQDRPDGLRFTADRVEPPTPDLWG